MPSALLAGVISIMPVERRERADAGRSRMGASAGAAGPPPPAADGEPVHGAYAEGYDSLLRRSLSLLAAWLTSDSMHMMSPEHGIFLVRTRLHIGSMHARSRMRMLARMRRAEAMTS